MRFSLVAVALCASCLPAFGQASEVSVSAGVSQLSSKELGSGYSLDDGWRFGFRLTLNNMRFFGHEFGYAYNRTKLKLRNVDQGGMAIHQGLYHFLAYGTPEGSRIRPFGAVGGHFSNFVFPGQSASYGQGSTKFGVNYGAGVKVRVTEIMGFRVDVKQYLTPKPFREELGGSGTLKHNEISVGLALFL